MDPMTCRTCEPFVDRRPSPRTFAHPDQPGSCCGFIQLIVSFLTLDFGDRGVTLRSRFAVEGSDADYPETVDGDYSWGRPMASIGTELAFLKRLFISLQPPATHAAQDLIFKVI